MDGRHRRGKSGRSGQKCPYCGPSGPTILALRSNLLIRAMPTTRVSSNGQIVIPAPVRQALQWGDGTELVVVQIKDGVLLKAASSAPRRLPTEEQIRAVVAGRVAEPSRRSAG